MGLAGVGQREGSLLTGCQAADMLMAGEVLRSVCLWIVRCLDLHVNKRTCMLRVPLIQRPGLQRTRPAAISVSGCALMARKLRVRDDDLETRDVAVAAQSLLQLTWVQSVACSCLLTSGQTRVHRKIKFPASHKDQTCIPLLRRSQDLINVELLRHAVLGCGKG